MKFRHICSFVLASSLLIAPSVVNARQIQPKEQVALSSSSTTDAGWQNLCKDPKLVGDKLVVSSQWVKEHKNFLSHFFKGTYKASWVTLKKTKISESHPGASTSKTLNKSNATIIFPTLYRAFEYGDTAKKDWEKTAKTVSLACAKLKPETEFTFDISNDSQLTVTHRPFDGKATDLITSNIELFPKVNNETVTYSYDAREFRYEITRGNLDSGAERVSVSITKQQNGDINVVEYYRKISKSVADKTETLNRFCFKKLR